MIIEELRKAGLPEHLSWVPIIESGFKVRALSRARALGMWQFIRSTGYRYGLKQDKYVDERMDPVKATRAAIKYLAELHDFFGDWTTALASYNCGELRVQNVIKAQKIDYLDNFWDVFNNLPYETARFVPRIIAVMLIIENPAKYGFTLPTPDPPLAWETVTVGQPVKLASISATLGLDPLILSFLNPELRHDSTPNYDYALKVPVGYGEKVLAALPALPRYIPPDVVYGWHTVKSGDTLGAIARRYRTSTDAIMRLNGIKNPRTSRSGGSSRSRARAIRRSPSQAAGRPRSCRSRRRNPRGRRRGPVRRGTGCPTGRASPGREDCVCHQRRRYALYPGPAIQYDGRKDQGGQRACRRRPERRAKARHQRREDISLGSGNPISRRPLRSPAPAYLRGRACL